MRVAAAALTVTCGYPAALVGVSSLALGGIAIALAIALWPHKTTAPKEEPQAAGNVLPDAVTRLPKDYSQLPQAPKLGPPLPGDLGKPMLKAGVVTPPIASTPSPEQQRIAQEQDAARTSHLFAIGNTSPATASASSTNSPAPTPTAGQTSSDPTNIENMQDSKIAFANTGGGQETSLSCIQHPTSSSTSSKQAGSSTPR